MGRVTFNVCNSPYGTSVDKGDGGRQMCQREACWLPASTTLRLSPGEDLRGQAQLSVPSSVPGTK